MKVAIMQPYIFPYIGYFQMVGNVDFFVFYDDVNFINRGWINRNRVLVNGKPTYITITLKEASQNKLINDISIFEEKKCFDKILKTIEQNYKKAPYFEPTYNLIKTLFDKKFENIGHLAAESIKHFAYYLELKTEFYYSSEKFPNTKGSERADRLIEITKSIGAETLINAIGGQELYNKKYFKEKGVELFFIKTKEISYPQLSTEEFQPHLSIIDVLMHNSKEEVKKLLNKFELI